MGCFVPHFIPRFIVVSINQISAVKGVSPPKAKFTILLSNGKFALFIVCVPGKNTSHISPPFTNIASCP